MVHDDTVDLDASVATSRKKLIDASGAGTSLLSPGWLTELGRLYGGKAVSLAKLSALLVNSRSLLPRLKLERKSNVIESWRKPYRDQVACLQDVPVAKANPADIQDLLGGALFKALYKWMQESGPVYLLPTGTIATRHVNLSIQMHSNDMTFSVF